MNAETHAERRIEVIKLSTLGEETWRYEGKLLRKDEHCLLLEAFFDREDTIFHGMLLGKGDRFLETYYADRWYNIFEVHSRDDDSLRGWYCNIATPAKFLDNQISYIDLALDLLVFPDGRQIILDEDEFVELEISENIRLQAQNAMKRLQAHFRRYPGG